MRNAGQDGERLVSLERLEEEISELAAHIHAATCRWLVLVAEFDRRDGWAVWGCRSCAQWLSWRCGLAPGASREHLRVARRLAELPLVREAFGAGELSYSKVRAVTRVACAGTESDLVELARHATAAQLERLVRAYRGAAAAQLDRANGAFAERYLDWSWDDDGSLILRGKLPAEDGALLLAALEAARDRLRANAVADRDDDADVSAETPVGSGGDGEVVSAETSSGADLADAGASAEAPERVGAGNVEALIAIADASLAGNLAQRSAGERYQLVLHVDAAALQDDDPAARCELEDGPALPFETARRLACDASLIAMVERGGRPLTVGRRTRAIPSALRRALHSRDGGCRFPGCTQRQFVDAHHVEHWARGGETKLTNLVLLCRHHHRLVHEGGFTLQRGARGVVFRRPDGRSIPSVPRVRRGDHGQLRQDNRRAGLALGPDSCTARSAGDRLDYDIAIEGLMIKAIRALEPPSPPSPPPPDVSPGPG